VHKSCFVLDKQLLCKLSSKERDGCICRNLQKNKALYIINQPIRSWNHMLTLFASISEFDFRFFFQDRDDSVLFRLSFDFFLFAIHFLNEFHTRLVACSNPFHSLPLL
jgi:hypothetical protein